MTAKEMKDNDFINFQDDFYNLLEKYGVGSIDIEHPQYMTILLLRNKVVEFIEQEMYNQTFNNQEYLNNCLKDMRATLEHLIQDAIDKDKPLDLPIIKMQQEKILAFQQQIKNLETN